VAYDRQRPRKSTPADAGRDRRRAAGAVASPCQNVNEWLLFALPPRHAATPVTVELILLRSVAVTTYRPPRAAYSTPVSDEADAFAFATVLYGPSTKTIALLSRSDVLPTFASHHWPFLFQWARLRPAFVRHESGEVPGADAGALSGAVVTPGVAGGGLEWDVVDDDPLGVVPAGVEVAAAAEGCEAAGFLAGSALAEVVVLAVVVAGAGSVLGCTAATVVVEPLDDEWLDDELLEPHADRLIMAVISVAASALRLPVPRAWPINVSSDSVMDGHAHGALSVRSG
jgi:hypothetical protein